MLFRSLAAIGFLLIAAGCAAAQDESKKDPASVSAEEDQPRSFESKGRITAGGKNVAYKVIAGETYIENDKGEPVASIFSTSYIADGFADPRTRPVAFIFNGGPGSASLWLHMGVFGPMRVRLPSGPDASPDDDGAAPFDLIANSESIIDVADMVFIDPVGTGWSKTLGEGKTDDYWGVKQDAASVREFIRRWLVEHKRWNSPKYLIGESYGTTRSAALLEALESGWTDIAVNGVVLISTVLNFGLDATDAGNDVGYIGLMPGYAATAWYHGKVDRSQWGDDLERFLNEARAFATDEYMPALLKGQMAPQAERDAVAARLASFTGLSESYVRRSNMRIPLRRFMRELLRDEGMAVGRLDSRFTGVEVDGVGENPEYDPSAYGIDAAYTAGMLDYFSRDLGVDIKDPYTTLGGVRGWNWDAEDGGGENAYVNVAPWVERAMRQNKDLRILSANGYYDLATPFFGTEMTLAQPGFDRSRLTITYYEAGHMMYIHQPSLEALAKDVRSFIRNEQ
ncbi:S10 family peptidase [Hyphococcus sp.]|uniref:S10 family peptidase n=1 Tax=Hyphococcus sp. TaxID=2038636 RepID=UPI00207F7D1A|nr:MAG: peptidase S10 [Marinicaulis sp.]